MQETKNVIRKQMLEKRKQMTEQEIKIKSECVIKNIFTLKYFEEAEWIFTYINMGAEVQTIPLIEKAWSIGKKVAVPVAVRGTRDLYFVEIKSFNGLKRSKIGVMEPVSNKEEEQIPKEGTFFIVPGSVFDTSGNRFGYGGGYYDTYFERFPKLKRNALSFEIQVVEDMLPVEIHDKKMDIIITENRILRFDKKS